MIKYIVASIAIVASVSCTYAQGKINGLFLTAEDFKNQEMSYSTDCRTGKHKIRLNDFFARSYITVVHDSQVYKLNKSEIYGYKNCNGRTVRFLNTKELVLLNPGESIAIYRHEVAKPPRGKTNVTNYYFSKDATSPELPLTVSNLKNAFPDDHFFHDEIDRSFKYNTELATYDALHKMYKINWLLKEIDEQTIVIPKKNKVL